MLPDIDKASAGCLYLTCPKKDGKQVNRDGRKRTRSIFQTSDQ